MSLKSVMNKKKRNRKKKNKDGTARLSNDEVCSMPTEDLCQYIQNGNLQDPNGGKNSGRMKMSPQQQQQYIQAHQNDMVEDFNKFK